MCKICQNIKFNALKNILKNNKKQILKKFIYDENIPLEAFYVSFMKRLKNLLNKNVFTMAMALKNSGHVDGFLLVENSPWDSNHFGINIGKMRLALFNPNIDFEGRRYLFRNMMDKAASQGLDLITCRVDFNDLQTVHALEKEGGMLADILLTFYINLNNANYARDYFESVKSTLNFDIATADVADTEALSQIGRETFENDHFHSDHRLPKEKCDELYANWISNSVKGNADKVFVAKKYNMPIGFIACKIEKVNDKYCYGVIDLIGVNKEFQGMGAGSSLVTEALKWFSRYTASVYVGTQAQNTQAIRLYENKGFRHVFSEATLHLWISD